jgi:hypothetical protein
MWKHATSATLVLAMNAAGPAATGDRQAVLMDGSYEVEVRLELPHVEDAAVTKLETICISNANGGGSHGLAVLSDNNPLARCPISNVRETGGSLTFDVVCEGRNGAKASASYLLDSQQFRGRIAMTMGGKNMTMTETQIGRRIGDCAPAQ